MTLRIAEWHSDGSGSPPGLDALAAAATEADGRKPIDESALAELKAGAKEMPHAAFIVNDGDALVGYAHVSYRESGNGRRLDVVTHPAYRRRGIGTELMRHVVDHVAWDGGGTIHLWVASNAQEWVRALAERFQMRVTRRLLQQHAPLPAPSIPIPAQITVRGFRDTDADGWLTLHNEVFAAHPDAAGWTPTDLSWRMGEPWFYPSGFRLAFDDAGLVAYCWMKIHDHPDPAHDPADSTTKLVGEIYLLGVAPRGRSRGLADVVASDGLSWATARGATRAMLYVDEDNAPALRLYERFGYSTTRVDVCLEAEIAPR